MHSERSWRKTFRVVCLLLFVPSHFAGQTTSHLAKRLASADAALRANLPLQALAAYQQALQLQPSSESAEIGIAKAYQKLANFNQARATLQHCIRQHPHSAAPLLAWAENDIEMQQYGPAMRHLNLALQKSPHNLAALLDRATVERVQGALDAAERDLQAASALKSAASLPYWHYLRGSVYADRNQNPAALKEAQISVALDPGNQRAKALLARLLVHTRNCARASALLREQAPQPGSARGEWLYLRARAFQCMGEKAAATAAMSAFNNYTRSREAEKQSRAQAEFLVTRAGQMALRNQLSGALDLCRQALQLDPQNAKAWAQAAKLYVSLGNISEAHRAITQALKSNPYQPEFLYVQGVILAREGDWRGAVNSLARTTAIDPMESDAYYQLGLVWERLGDRSRARKAFERALALDPNEPDYARAVRELQPYHPQ